MQMKCPNQWRPAETAATAAHSILLSLHLRAANGGWRLIDNLLCYTSLALQGLDSESSPWHYVLGELKPVWLPVL